MELKVVTQSDYLAQLVIGVLEVHSSLFDWFALQHDWQLRGAFFDSIVEVAAYVGTQSLSMVMPLLQQVGRVQCSSLCSVLHGAFFYVLQLFKMDSQ